MRVSITIAFLVLVAALVVCAAVAARSNKAMGKDVARLLVALLPPMCGNLAIILSGNVLVARIGCYTYYLGMDVTVLALLYFTLDYCGIDYRDKTLGSIIKALILIDVVQLLLNPFFGHAFTTEAIVVEGATYHKLVPRLGQVFHRIVDYGLFLSALVTFAIKTARAPRIYVERYLVILLSMIFCGAWQTYYIFSGTPVDRSMLGFGFFGLLIFYFSLYYKPVRLLDRMLARVVSDMGESLFFFDADGTCIYANAAGLRLLHLAQDNIEKVPRRLGRFFGALPTGEGNWTRQCQVSLGGNVRYYALDHRGSIDDRGVRVGSFLSVRDRTEEEVELRRETHNATHDRLTGLYNQEHLYQRICEQLAAKPDVRHVVVGVDVKDFKIVNDIFSSEFGDLALRTIANWLRQFGEKGAVFGRISGDKFGLCMPADSFDAETINEELNRFVVSDGHVEHSILVHLGVYEVRRADSDVSVMFDHAFMAMATVKQEYQNHLAYYDDAMRENVIWGQMISSQLAGALKDGQIRPYLQPMVNDGGDVVGAEVLVRWIHPQEGFLPPGRFIPVFEENGMVVQIDRYMWRCACEILASWKRRGIDLFLSVNISPKDFYFMDVYTEIRDLVRAYDIDPARLRLEITETVMMTDLEKRLRILDDLRSLGFLVEMDDFGSGYSSLNMLKDMPVDVLKIDMMFLYKSKDQLKAQTILQNIINLSGDLGIPSLTEGVETVEQRDMLLKMGCRLFQGYYFAKPMPVSEFEQFVKVA